MEDLAKFESAVQRELAWRKRELSDLRAAAHRAGPGERYIFRAGQVLLCAHWEGFLKSAASAYVQHALAQKIRLRELSSPLVAVSLYRAVMQAADAKYPGSEHHHLRLADQIVEGVDSEPDDRTAWDVDTEGNPGSDTVERVLRSIGVSPNLDLDDAAWSTTKVFINEHVVRDRNAIAHGEGKPISRDELLDRVDRLLRLMDSLGELLMVAAQRRQYLRPTEAAGSA